MFRKWHDLDSFAHVLRARNQSHWLKDYGPVVYRPKIKLHGTNAAIRVTPKGVFAQSRSQVISVQNDNAGFAAWLEPRKHYFDDFVEHMRQVGYADDCGITYYGEWFGPGVQKGVACSKIPTKNFAIFAQSIDPRDGNENGWFHCDPGFIAIPKSFNTDDPTIKILPWASEGIRVDFDDPESVALFIEDVNARVKECEKVDPWIAAEYGIEGTGEGFVYYAEPFSSDPYLKGFMFKAKGEEHRVNKTKEAAQVDPERLRNVAAYADFTVTPARLEQAYSEAVKGVADPKLTGDFLRWVATDIIKECSIELSESGLEWKQVAGEISKRARDWYLKKANEIPVAAE